MDVQTAESVLSPHKVSCRYAENQRAVLKGISAEFEPGKLYGVIVVTHSMAVSGYADEVLGWFVER
ncbi:hypothetical protein GA0061077_1224 [Bifidobacterium commune]|uniref:Uncharacterized protein n=1 Tax=Bifidobacterium commune TaxID=1505727 RepID=A0A1C4H6S9_9BIFI|nr:hypothetical protein [Bifidobacterium commune]SCC80492.1 hypothetical protein GA0061077_1224 [Bifidobacterium commune]